MPRSSPRSACVYDSTNDFAAPDAVVSRLATALPRLIDVAACPDRIVPVAAIPRRGRTAKPDRDALRKLVA